MNFDKKISLNQILLLLLFLVIPFVMSETDSSKILLLESPTLPNFVIEYASFLRWIILIYTIFFVLLKITNSKARLPKVIFYFFNFYIIQFIVSLIWFTDTLRYLGLMMFSVSVPYFVFNTLRENVKTIVFWSTLIIYFQLLAAIYYGYLSTLSGGRFQGFVNNPNAYGIIALFWLSFLSLNKGYVNSRILKYSNIIAIVLIVITILLSGSRSALVGLVIMLFLVLGFKKKKKIWNFIAICFIGLLFYLVSDIPYFQSVFRSLNVDDARLLVWDKSIDLVRNNIWGYGMYAPQELVGTGNIHNCYLRYLLTMGVIPTIIAFLFYFYFIFKSFYRTRIPVVLLAIILSFTIMNYAEDYYMGIGSTATIYFFMIIGYILYYLDIRRKYLWLKRRAKLKIHS